MDRLRKLLCAFLLLVFVLPLAGCWDRRELQERNLVLAAALDLADEGLKPGQSQETVKAETFVQPTGGKRYRLSLQILKYQAKGVGGKGGGGQGARKTFVLSNTGESLFEMVRDMLGQSSRALYFEHMQVVIISEAVLRQTNLAPILDFFFRDAEMRSRIRVYATPGQARPLLEFKPPTGEPGGIYLNNIARNHVKNAHIGAARTDLGHIIQTLDNDADVIMPRIDIQDEVVKIRGLAVFRRDRFSGYLDEYAVQGIRFARGTERGAIITAPCPVHPGEILALELVKHETKLTPHVAGDNIYFTLDINMTGNLSEVHGAQPNTYDYKNKDALEQAFAQEVLANVSYAARQSQIVGCDTLYFASKLKAHEPEAWKRVKERWDEIYPAILLYTSVNVRIRNIGVHR